MLAIAGAAIIAGAMPANVKASTVEELQAQLSQLLALIQSLQTQLAQMQGGTTAWCHNFNTNLKINDNNGEACTLEAVLIREKVLDRSLGSVGGVNSTCEFDEEIASAVVEFQEKYANEILKPFGLQHGTGYVGKSTRAKLNKIYGCGNGNGGGGGERACTTEAKLCPDGSYVSRSGPSCEFTACPIRSCVGEGEASFTIKTPYIVYKGETCCGGLTKLDNSTGDGTSASMCATRKDSFVCAYCGNGVCGKSENVCNCPSDCKTTATKSITVSSPNGGEQWTFGASQVITWKSVGVRNATIYVISDSGMLKIADVNAISGQYRFTPQENQGFPGYVPKLISGRYKVNIWGTDRTDGTIDMNDPQDMSDNYFTITSSVSENLPPVIDGVTAPTQLKVNEQGTWVIKMHDPENDTMGYLVDWGDSSSGGSSGGSSPSTMFNDHVQTTTFSHSYSKAGTYTVTFGVSDDMNPLRSVKTSTTVKVIENIIPLDLSDLIVKDISWRDYGVNKKMFDITIQNIGSASALLPSNFLINIYKNTFGYNVGYANVSNIVGGLGDLNPKILMPNIALPFSVGIDRNLLLDATNFIAYVDTTNMVKESNENNNSLSKPIERTAQITCTDSDQGKIDYFTKGTTSWGPFSGIMQTATDGCDVAGVTLSEMYCLDGYSRVTYYTCPNGCSNGACNSQPQTISVISPNGGEQLELGQTYTINWQSTGFPSTSKIGISYCTDTSTPMCYSVNGATSLSSDIKSFGWLVPYPMVQESLGGSITSGDKWKIQVEELLPDGKTGVWDRSNSYFTVFSISTQ